MRKWQKALIPLGFLLCCVQCSKKAEDKESQGLIYLKENPKILKPKPYPMNSKAVLIKGAKIMTASGPIYEKANLLMQNGRIEKIAEGEIHVNEGTEVIEGKGLTLTPGLIDIHSHMGLGASPSLDAHHEYNESVATTTPHVWAEHGFWPQDPNLWKALAGGITTIQVLPGSTNLIGGRSFIAKLLPQLTAREMRFPKAPQGLKMACGENPKRVYEKKGLKTRMGNVAGYRKAYQEALEYARQWDQYEKKKARGEAKAGGMPKRDFALESLVKVLEGKILVHFHCYRADDIGAILDVAKEFGFQIRAVHHGLEAYKLSKRLAKEQVAVATWSDWWGFKAEAFDGIPYNAALLEEAGGRPIIHSDSPVDVRFLNVEAGKALAAGKKLGLKITENQALRWVTANGAWAMGLEKQIGTIEEGKMADVVAWDGHPFSVYSKAQYVFINGKKVFDRKKKQHFMGDFQVGHPGAQLRDGREFSPSPVVQKIPWSSQALSPTPRLKGKEFIISQAKVFINGKWREKTSVHVKNGKIVGINPKDSPSLPTVDGQGKWLTPGLIEAHSTLGLVDVLIDSAAQDISPSRDTPTPDYRAVDALNTHNSRLANRRQEGTLTAISGSFGNFASSTAVAFDLTTDRVLNPGVALFGSVVKKGYGSNKTTRSELWNHIRQFMEDVVAYNKNPKAFNRGQSRPLVAPSGQLAAMKPVLEGKRPWVIKAHRADDIKKLIDLKKKYNKGAYKLKLVILGGTEAWKWAKQLRTHRIPVMMTPSLQTARDFDRVEARLDQAAYLHKQGVKLILMDGSAWKGTGRTRQEAGFAVKYGLNPEAALKAITETPGEVFGLQRGKIKKGAEANLVMWNGDPLEPTSWATHIWIGGKPQTLLNRHRALADKYLKTLRE